jgi:hypothetical protein
MIAVEKKCNGRTVQSLLNSIASKQPLLADEIMPLDRLTEGDSRTKKHAEYCTGDA